ncbi:TNF receptor-associated factor 1-like [Protobothrops mucrosquamatus]|uniref:TNF receptor-associated factor 1-like n=1 Tax=Protobothrops mucrosquamatus TaxID=103944 RepID=UPI0010FB5CE3|nr:TNF receptor-associated factor 1-like [Protobothrops mucrosquamatus]
MPPQHPLLNNTLPQFVSLDFPLDHLLEQLRPNLKIRQQVAELETRQKTLENIVSVLSRELESHHILLCTSMYSFQIEQQDSLLALKDVMISNLVSRIQALEQTSYDGCFLWKIPRVAIRMREAQMGKRPALYSPPFYTTRYGYKLCLKLFLNGDGTGAGTHLSLFLVVMKGEHDFQLKWPFQHKVTFTLLDQVNNRHVSTSFRSLESSSSFQRPINETNVASGIPTFYPLNSLHEPGTGYIHNDMLAIQAVIDTKA